MKRKLTPRDLARVWTVEEIRQSFAKSATQADAPKVGDKPREPASDAADQA